MISSGQRFYTAQEEAILRTARTAARNRAVNQFPGISYLATIIHSPTDKINPSP